MLSIFEEESKMPIIEERIIEQFGYFDKELLILEKKYHDRFCPDKELLILERKFHKRFCPDKELSIWSKIK